MISADEKTSIQARCRCHPTLPPTQARSMRVEREYAQRRALAYPAAWYVHRAKVFGRCEAETGIEPFGRLVQQVRTQEPYASAHRVFWIVDNGSSDRGKAPSNASKANGGTYASFISLSMRPGSIRFEIFFSVLQHNVLTPNDFTDLAEVADRLIAFQATYETIAKPFEWRFTRSDLAALLRRPDEREALRAAA